MPPAPRPPLGPVLGPVLDPLRRAHPDVAVVARPPVDPRPPADPASVAEAAALADRTVAVALDVARALGRPAATVSGTWWRSGDRGRHRHVVRAGFRDLGPAAVEPLVARLARRLRADGWDAGATPGADDGPLRLVLVARRGPVRLRAAVYRDDDAGAVDLRVESADVALDGATLAALREREEHR